MCHKYRQTQTTNRFKTLLRMPGIAWHYTEVVYLCLKLAMQTSFYIIQSHCYFVMVENNITKIRFLYHNHVDPKNR